MSLEELTHSTGRDVQRGRDLIRRSWSPEERDKREKLAKSRQASLIALLLTPAVFPRRVA